MKHIRQSREAGEHSRGDFLEEVVPEPESRGKAPFQEAQDRLAPSPEGTAGPTAKASAQEAGGGRGTWAHWGDAGRGHL